MKDLTLYTLYRKSTSGGISWSCLKKSATDNVGCFLPFINLYNLSTFIISIIENKFEKTTSNLNKCSTSKYVNDKCQYIIRIKHSVNNIAVRLSLIASWLVCPTQRTSWCTRLDCCNAFTMFPALSETMANTSPMPHSSSTCSRASRRLSAVWRSRLWHTLIT